MDGSIRSRDGRGARYSAILSRMHGTYADARTECPGGDQMTPSAYDQWLALYEASAQRDATFSTMSGVALAPVRRPEQVRRRTSSRTWRHAGRTLHRVQATGRRPTGSSGHLRDILSWRQHRFRAFATKWRCTERRGRP